MFTQLKIILVYPLSTEVLVGTGFRCSMPSYTTWLQCIQLAIYPPEHGILLLEAVGLQLEPYRWRPCGVTWDSKASVPISQQVVLSL